MNATPPAVKIEMIERSIRCFFLGLFGLLLPVIGTGMTVSALRQFWRVKQIRGGLWNPAHRYLFWGTVFARLAVVLLLLEITAIAAVWTMESR